MMHGGKRSGIARKSQHVLPSMGKRGAAFLLAVYLSALMLLLLGGVSLQRTNTEMHAAQISRDVQQAFWQSEAALDQSIFRSKTEALKTLTSYPVSFLSGSGSFKIVPTYAEIYNNNRSDRGHREKYVMNLYQHVTKKITGKAVSPSGVVTQNVSAYFDDYEPLRGVWASGTIAVGGGRNIKAGDVFLSGDLYGQLGSVVSDINDDLLKLNGLVDVTDPNVWNKTGTDRWQAELAYWKLLASTELRSIKNGYKYINLFNGHPLNESENQSGGTYSNVNFVNGAMADSTGHVDGALTVGMMELPANAFDRVQCTNELQISGGRVDIDDGFRCEPDSPSNPPNVNCTGRVEDREAKKGRIRICVSALVPADEAGWMNTLLNQDNMPHIVFHQPTTLVVTGGHAFDFNKTPDLRVPIPNFFIPLRVRDIPDISQNPNGIQRQWQVTIGAKISGVDAFGAPVPVDIFEAEAKARASDHTDHGMIFMKPGDNFQGSVYAPNATVVMRARDCVGQRNCDSSSPLQIQYVVGKEVAIELEGDKIQIGGSDATKNPDDVNMPLLSWTNR